MRSNQRGMSESVQLAVLFPLLFGIFLLLLQWAFVAWAESTALAAAQESAAAAALYGAGEADGRAAAQRVLDNGAVGSPSISIDRGVTQTQAVVRGTAALVLFPYEIVAEAAAPVERVTHP